MNVLLNNFDPISLEQMSSVKLMNRTDQRHTQCRYHRRQ